MVIEAEKTRNGHLRLTVEDATGEMDALLMIDVAERVGNIAVDDVVAISGSLSKDGGIFFVSNALFPHVIEKDDPTLKDIIVSAAFISDIHIGAKNFLERDWNRILKWLHTDDDKAKSIKYMVMSEKGDIIDGVRFINNKKN